MPPKRPDSPSACTTPSTIHNDVLIAAFDAKIKFLETAVRERRRLENLHLIWDHNQQRLAQVAQKKSKAVDDNERAKLDTEEAKWQIKLDLAQFEYDEH